MKFYIKLFDGGLCIKSCRTSTPIHSSYEMGACVRLCVEGFAIQIRQLLGGGCLDDKKAKKWRRPLPNHFVWHTDMTRNSVPILIGLKALASVLVLCDLFLSFFFIFGIAAELSFRLSHNGSTIFKSTMNTSYLMHAYACDTLLAFSQLSGNFAFDVLISGSISHYTLISMKNYFRSYIFTLCV